MIRPYTASDHNQVMNIYNASKLDELAHEPKTVDLIPLQHDLARNKVIFDSNIYVIEQFNVIQGFIAIHRDNIAGLFVLPESRGQGLAKLLLKHVITQYPKPLTLQVVRSNSHAVYLYQSFGFKQIEASQAIYNGLSVPIIRMILENDPL